MIDDVPQGGEDVDSADGISEFRHFEISFRFSSSFGSQVASVLRTLLRLRCFPMWIEPYMEHLCCAT